MATVPDLYTIEPEAITDVPLPELALIVLTKIGTGRMAGEGFMRGFEHGYAPRADTDLRLRGNLVKVAVWEAWNWLITHDFILNYDKSNYMESFGATRLGIRAIEQGSLSA